MPHKIIKGSEARATIKSFLENEKNRTIKIALLGLEEVNVYIKTVQIIQKEYEHILHYFEKLSSGIEKLKNITKSNKELISVEEIKSCLAESDNLKIFNYPYSSLKLLSKTELLIRELGLLFRNGQKLLPSVSR
jgi:hypothetical protein